MLEEDLVNKSCWNWKQKTQGYLSLCEGEIIAALQIALKKEREIIDDEKKIKALVGKRWSG